MSDATSKTEDRAAGPVQVSFDQEAREAVGGFLVQVAQDLQASLAKMLETQEGFPSNRQGDQGA